MRCYAQRYASASAAAAAAAEAATRAREAADAAAQFANGDGLPAPPTTTHGPAHYPSVPHSGFLPGGFNGGDHPHVPTQEEVQRAYDEAPGPPSKGEPTVPTAPPHPEDPPAEDEANQLDDLAKRLEMLRRR